MERIDKELLRSKMISAGLTYEGLASECGIDRGTLSRRINGGTLRICDIEKIVDALKLTPDESMSIFLPFVVA